CKPPGSPCRVSSYNCCSSCKSYNKKCG
uniref:Omega-conotoxin RVIA n=1 Tax=Conus radiatus TaxID=61198 RepID=O16A_CONRA|nr:RecName: Full=Omega-conotoxin RVIA [Conus radiatus]